MAFKNRECLVTKLPHHRGISSWPHLKYIKLVSERSGSLSVLLHVGSIATPNLKVRRIYSYDRKVADTYQSYKSKLFFRTVVIYSHISIRGHQCINFFTFQICRQIPYIQTIPPRKWLLIHIHSRQVVGGSPHGSKFLLQQILTNADKISDNVLLKL